MSIKAFKKLADLHNYTIETLTQNDNGEIIRRKTYQMSKGKIVITITPLVGCGRGLWNYVIYDPLNIRTQLRSNVTLKDTVKNLNSLMELL